MKTKWINNINKELNGLEEDPEVIILLELLSTRLKILSNWNSPSHYGIYRFWFQKSKRINHKLAPALSTYLEATNIPE